MGQSRKMKYRTVGMREARFPCFVDEGIVTREVKHKESRGLSVTAI